MHAIKEINFDFSVSYRVLLHQALETAWEQQVPTLEFAKYFMLQVGEIGRELQATIDRFETWKAKLTIDPEAHTDPDQKSAFANMLPCYHRVFLDQGIFCINSIYRLARQIRSISHLF